MDTNQVVEPEDVYDENELAELQALVSTEYNETKQLTGENAKQATLGLLYYSTHRRKLETTWLTLVLYRDIALENNDFERVALYCEVITDIATMMEAAGWPLPVPATI